MANKVEMTRGAEQATKTRQEAQCLQWNLEFNLYNLQDRLNKEENAPSEAARRVEQAEDHIRQARERERPLSALHEELGELRQRLKQQEELQLHAQQMWKQELDGLDAARRVPQQVSQQSSSMPISSRTSDAGWEYVRSQVSSRRELSDFH